MSDLAEFLLARILGDEAAARATTPVPRGEWIATRDKHDPDDAPTALISGRNPDEGDVFLDDPEGYRYGAECIVHAADYQDDAESNLCHIARWDPARVLAECEAKRRIVDAYQDAKHHYDEEHDVDGAPKYSDGAVWAFLDKLEVWEQALKLIALPYADHPDYRQEWRP